MVMGNPFSCLKTQKQLKRGVKRGRAGNRTASVSSQSIVILRNRHSNDNTSHRWSTGNFQAILSATENLRSSNRHLQQSKEHLSRRVEYLEREMSSLSISKLENDQLEEKENELKRANDEIANLRKELEKEKRVRRSISNKIQKETSHKCDEILREIQNLSEKISENEKTVFENGMDSLLKNMEKTYDCLTPEVKECIWLLGDLIGPRLPKLIAVLKLNPVLITELTNNSKHVCEPERVWKVFSEWYKSKGDISMDDIASACKNIGIDVYKDKPMSKANKAILGQHRLLILENLDPNETVRRMEKCLQIEDDLREYIFSATVRVERIERLLSVLQVLGDEALIIFIEAIDSAGLNHVSSELLGAIHGRPMSLKDREVLKVLQYRLDRNWNIENILEYVKRNTLIPNIFQRYIYKATEKYVRLERLVEIMPVLEKNALDVFKKALQQSGHEAIFGGNSLSCSGEGNCEDTKEFAEPECDITKQKSVTPEKQAQTKKFSPRKRRCSSLEIAIRHPLMEEETNQNRKSELQMPIVSAEDIDSNEAAVKLSITDKSVMYSNPRNIELSSKPTGRCVVNRRSLVSEV